MIVPVKRLFLYLRRRGNTGNKKVDYTRRSFLGADVATDIGDVQRLPS